MSSTYTVSIDGSGLKSDITISQKSVDKYIHTCLRDSCELVADYAKKHHNFERNTGRLEDAIKFMVIDRLKTGIVEIDPEIASYGKFVHEPTGRFGPKHEDYPIFPVRAKALFYFSRKMGRMTFAAMTMHPGSKGDPFLYEALDKNRKNIDEIFATGLRRLING